MSTNYITDKQDEITKADIMRAVKHFGFKTEPTKDNNDNFVIHDDKNGIVCYVNKYQPGKEYIDFVRYGQNYDAVNDILEPIADFLGFNVYDEYSDYYQKQMSCDEEEEDGESDS